MKIKTDIFDIVVTDEDGGILWIAQEHAKSKHNFLRLVREYIKEADLDVEEIELDKTNIDTLVGKWTETGAEIEYWKDDKKGDVWYRIIIY